MKLLIVENELEQVQLYQDVIESYNKKNGLAITSVPKYGIADAREALNSSDYDAAIVDLKLSSNTLELEGLEIVNEILKNLRFPVFIVSGSIGQIETPENALFKKRLRDSDFTDILREIVSIYDTGITNILGRKGQINGYLNKIFWEHLATSVDVWINDEVRTPEQKQKTLLRYTLLHVQEYLEISEESDFEDYHTAEIYITPPVKPRVHTGDIVRNGEGKSFIVLTPSCDLAQAKAKDILIAAIEEESEGLLLENKNILKNKQALEEALNLAENNLKRLISNSYSNKYHFLPRYKNINAGLVNFQKIWSVRVKVFSKDFERIATINSSFTKDIVSRFSYYYARQGSPDFNVDEVYKSLL